MLAKPNIPNEYKKSLKIGTSSWKYDSWKGLIYDPDKNYKPKDYLADYSSYYSTVEIDQWFWSLFPNGVKLPKKETVKDYAKSVPDDFLFTVKAPNAITLTHHYSRQIKAYKDYAGKVNDFFLDNDLLKRFLETLEPMEGKLGPLMFQFEYLNKQKMPSRKAFLDKLNDFFEKAPKDFKYAIECRNPNYLKDDFFDFLAGHNLCFVLLDGYYMPPIWEIINVHKINTGAVTIIRLQGREREEMDKKTKKKWDEIVDDRNNDIKVLSACIKENTSKGNTTIVNVNNHYEGCAPLTIQRIAECL